MLEATREESTRLAQAWVIKGSSSVSTRFLDSFCFSITNIFSRSIRMLTRNFAHSLVVLEAVMTWALSTLKKCSKSNIKSENNTTMFTIDTKNAIGIYAMSRYWATLSSCRKGGAHILFYFYFL